MCDSWGWNCRPSTAPACTLPRAHTCCALPRAHTCCALPRANTCSAHNRLPTSPLRRPWLLYAGSVPHRQHSWLQRMPLAGTCGCHMAALGRECAPVWARVPRRTHARVGREYAWHCSPPHLQQAGGSAHLPGIVPALVTHTHTHTRPFTSDQVHSSKPHATLADMVTPTALLLPEGCRAGVGQVGLRQLSGPGNEQDTTWQWHALCSSAGNTP